MAARIVEVLVDRLMVECWDFSDSEACLFGLEGRGGRRGGEGRGGDRQ